MARTFWSLSAVILGYVTVRFYGEIGDGLAVGFNAAWPVIWHALQIIVLVPVGIVAGFLLLCFLVMVSDNLGQ